MNGDSGLKSKKSQSGRDIAVRKELIYESVELGPQQTNSLYLLRLDRVVMDKYFWQGKKIRVNYVL